MYVIRNTNTNNYVRMSSTRGGFPNESGTLTTAHIWKELKHAKHYFSLFPDNRDWVIEELVMSTKPISE